MSKTLKMSKTKDRKPAKAAKAKKSYCGRCERTRMAKFFNKNAARKDGMADWCKECLKEWRQERAKG